MESGIRQLGLNSCFLLAGSMTWGNFLTPVSLGFLTCEVRIFVVIHRVIVRIT